MEIDEKKRKKKGNIQMTMTDFEWKLHLHNNLESFAQLSSITDLMRLK